MRHVALEEAFSIPELAERQPPAWTGGAPAAPAFVPYRYEHAGHYERCVLARRA